MTLLFVENRYKTYFFEPIAKRLKQEGHTIHWIIQNKIFTPKGQFNIHKIKYPKHEQLNGYTKDEGVEQAIRSDRQLNYFSKAKASYFYYYNDEIKQLLQNIKPDVVFGESTAFHELLTINNCKLLDILFLHPSTCRYPTGRFSFYKNDTLNPFQGSGEKLNKDEAQMVISEIVNRTSLPDYMKPIKTGNIYKFKDKLKKIIAYTLGEHYNTPNPRIKYNLEKQKKDNIKNWDSMASNEVIKANNFNVLYPMQMQPEANIDVWGRKYRNQSQLVSEIHSSLPEGCILYVKPNPKSKYELDNKLHKVVRENRTIIPLHHNTKMDTILANIDLVITVTGTVAIECILKNKPVVNLVKTVNNTAENCIFIESLKRELTSQISKIKNNTFKKIDDGAKMNFINVLNSTSYKGIISDPFSDSNCVSEDNIEDVVHAFKDVLKLYSEKPN